MSRNKSILYIKYNIDISISYVREKGNVVWIEQSQPYLC